jgi:hypothetical protein
MQQIRRLPDFGDLRPLGTRCNRPPSLRKTNDKERRFDMDNQQEIGKKRD